MKRRILGILVCPSCGGGLGLEVLAAKDKGKEILDGILGCRKCKKSYPVINGIPRMLHPSMINRALLRDFSEKYKKRLPESFGTGDAPVTEKEKKRTSKSFGFQWNVFSRMFEEYEQNFLNYIKPLKPSFFKNKLVLDAGCGFGRHTYYAAKYGSEVVGFDLSDAVEAAYENCRKLEKAHIVQGDIYNPPFKRSFDFIMSIGVLHHLPDPQKGFMQLVKLMRKGTKIFVWLYGREGRWFKVHMVGNLRKVTTRMPHRTLYYCCYAPAAVYHVLNHVHNFLARHNKTKNLSRHVPFSGYAKFPFGVKHADAFDLLATPLDNYYRREDVKKWARDAGLEGVRITSLDGKSWRLFGRK